MQTDLFCNLLKFDMKIFLIEWNDLKNVICFAYHFVHWNNFERIQGRVVRQKFLESRFCKVFPENRFQYPYVLS